MSWRQNFTCGKDGDLYKLVVLLGVVVSVLPACALGIGRTSAVTAGLVTGDGTAERGWVSRGNDGLYMWNSLGVVADSAVRLPVGVVGGIKKAWLSGGIDGVNSSSGGQDELYYDFTAAYFGFGVGATYSYFADSSIDFSDDYSLKHEGSGWAGRLSWAPAPAVSIDASYGGLSGPLTLAGRSQPAISSVEDAKVRRWSIGGHIGVFSGGYMTINLRFDLLHVAGELPLENRVVGWSAWGPSFAIEGALF